MSKLVLVPSSSPPSQLEGVSWDGREEGKRQPGYAYLPFLARLCHFLLCMPDLKLSSSVGGSGKKNRKKNIINVSK